TVSCYLGRNRKPLPRRDVSYAPKVIVSGGFIMCTGMSLSKEDRWSRMYFRYCNAFKFSFITMCCDCSDPFETHPLLSSKSKDKVNQQARKTGKSRQHRGSSHSEGKTTHRSKHGIRQSFATCNSYKSCLSALILMHLCELRNIIFFISLMF
ncbi:unnamed protein product, partial [Larinioides sclopetarius]